MPERIVRAAALVSVAPAQAPDLDWFDGMTEANIKDFTMADGDIAVLTQRLQEVADRTREDPESILHDLRHELTPLDLRVVSSAALRRLLAETYREALRHGAGGWIDDVLAARAEWGFSLEAITVPVLLWHGAQDNLSPASHTRWLARKIGSAVVRIERDSAHFGAVEVLPEILSWLAARDAPPRL
jgi:pimeloyl-ACP methyl ester carboxylesterase